MRAYAIVVPVAVSAVAASAAHAAVLPDGVSSLRGKSRGLSALITYEKAKHSINGFAISYTCRGKAVVTDSDIYTIADGGDDTKPLATTTAGGKLTKTLTGKITRFSEDGTRRIGPGKVDLKLTVSRSGSKRLIRGSALVRSGKCPSVTLTLRLSGPP